MLRWSWLVVAVGCGFTHGTGARIDGNTDTKPVIDAPTADTFVAPVDGQECWSVPGVTVSVCLTTALGGTRTITNDVTIDTADPSDCAVLRPGSADVCVIAAKTITITSGDRLKAGGARPLVLLAETIDVQGEIDVASHVGGSQGAASDLPGCMTGNNPSSGGGGQGGSFGGKGGDGGNQDNTNNTRGTAGNALTNVTVLRGGCPGGNGGGANNSLGHGGGAVLLVANAITIGSAGVINASGAGAQGANQTNHGGGGAGSGGMIVLAAPMITNSGQLFANGGHGGGGSGDKNDGADGTDPPGPTSGGNGGNGGDNAGDGAAGYPSSMRNAPSGNGGGNGGGGAGGGAGIIHVYSQSTVGGPNVSPQPS